MWFPENFQEHLFYGTRSGDFWLLRLVLSDFYAWFMTLKQTKQI